MLGSRRPKGFSQDSCAEISPLESLLHQAWLQSHKNKVQRRISSAPSTDVSVGRRAVSSPAQSGIGFPQTNDQEVVESFYFHKSRLDASTMLVSQFALPKLKCYSEKTYIPRSVSVVQWTYKVPSANQGWAPPSKSLVGSSCHSSGNPSLCATESGDSGTGSVNFEGQGETLPSSSPNGNFINENLENDKPMPHQTSACKAMSREIADLIGLKSSVESEASDILDCESCWADSEPYHSEAEMRVLENSSAYQAMAKEIAELISPNSTLDGDRTELLGDELCTRGDFRPTEEQAARKMLEAYATLLSKHISDMSINSDPPNSDTYPMFKQRTADTDTILTYIDEDWKLYLQSINQNFTPTPNFDFNKLLCDGVGGTRVSAATGVASSCGGLTELLYRCAFAVSQGNVRDATILLAELRHNSSVYGNATQRMAHYFMEALVARLSGTGEKLYTAINNNCPSAAIVFKAIRLYTENCPFLKLGHCFIIKSLVDAFEGATRVHVIYYGIGYGVEFPSLMQQLRQRPDGPPHLRITGIDSPHPGDDPCLKINETGHRLEAFAAEWGVPFEFVALTGCWESITATDVNLRDDEVLAVCSDKLYHLLDESVLATSPREVFLRRIRSMNPKVFVIVGPNAGLNAPFFMTRFRESVEHYSAVFEGLEISMPPDDPDRVLVEKQIFGAEIMNVVACEGQTRVVRIEPYRQWQNRLQRAGFVQLPFKDIVRSKIKTMMAVFHKDYGVCKDDGWFLMGIRNRIVKFCSAWEPRKSQSLHPF